MKGIIDNVKNNKEQISKNIARFIPIEISIKSRLEVFEKNAPLILDKYFKKDALTSVVIPAEEKMNILPEQETTNTDINIQDIKIPVVFEKKTWKFEFKSRNNHSINKQDFLDFVLKYIDKSFYTVDYKNPNMTVLVEITNDLLCLSVLEDYYENKCYNLLTLSKSDEEINLQRDNLISMQHK